MPISKFSFTLTQEPNFHENFIDLTEYADVSKASRARDLGRKFTKMIGNKIGSTAHRNFNEYLEAGNKLSYVELK